MIPESREVDFSASHDLTPGQRKEAVGLRRGLVLVLVLVLIRSKSRKSH